MCVCTCVGHYVLDSICSEPDFPLASSLRSPGEESGCKAKPHGAELPHLLCVASWGVRRRERLATTLPYCVSRVAVALLAVTSLSHREAATETSGGVLLPQAERVRQRSDYRRRQGFQ